MLNLKFLKKKFQFCSKVKLNSAVYFDFKNIILWNLNMSKIEYSNTGGICIKIIECLKALTREPPPNKRRNSNFLNK